MHTPIYLCGLTYKRGHTKTYVEGDLNAHASIDLRKREESAMVVILSAPRAEM